MAQDQYGNYVANIYPSPISPLPTSMFGGSSGTGAPNDADGSNGDTYVDSSTGDLYIKSGDTWNLFSGGPGGATEVYFISTPGQNPNNVTTGTRPALAYDAAGGVWIKTGSGTNNTGWEQRL